MTEKSKYLIIAAALMMLKISFAQNSRLDSLRRVLRNCTVDTARVNIMNLIAFEQESLGNYDSVLVYAHKALKLSNKINYKTGIAYSLNNIGLTQLSSEIDKAVKTFRVALKMAEESDDDEAVSQILVNLGLSEFNRSDYNRSMEYFKRAMSMAIKKNDKELEAKIYGNMGIVHHHRADYPSAIDCYLKAIRIGEVNGIDQVVINNLTNLGNTYLQQGDYDKAMANFTHSLKELEKLGNKEGVAVCLCNIGMIHYQLSQNTEALNFFQKALVIESELDSKRDMAMNLLNIGNVFKEMGDNEKLTEEKKDSLHTLAFTRFNEALRLFEKSDYRIGVAIALGNIGELQMQRNNKQEAIKSLTASLDISESLNDLEGVAVTSRCLSEINESSENYKAALMYYGKHIAAGDSIASEENIRKQIQVEMQYEFDKKETTARADQDKKDAVTRIIIYSISGGLFLVVLLAIFIFRGYRQKQKANDIISLQKEEMEKQKYLVEEKQKEILDSIHYARRIQKALLANEKYIVKAMDRLKK